MLIEILKEIWKWDSFLRAIAHSPIFNFAKLFKNELSSLKSSRVKFCMNSHVYVEKNMFLEAGISGKPQTSEIENFEEAHSSNKPLNAPLNFVLESIVRRITWFGSLPGNQAHSSPRPVVPISAKNQLSTSRSKCRQKWEHSSAQSRQF